MDHRNIDPSFAAARIGFVILAETPVAPQPGKGSLHNPTLGQDHKVMKVHRLEYGCQQPVTAALHPVGYGRIGAVGPKDAQPRQASPHLLQQGLGRIAILHIGGEHRQSPDQAQRIDEQMPLAASDFFPASYPRSPPASVVLTDWLSMMAALGVGSRPSTCRTSTRSRAWICSSRPASRQV